MALNKKADTGLAATSGEGYSYANLFNPLSPIMGGGDKIPGFVSSMFPGNDRAAWLVSKAGAAGLLAAAVLGSVRVAQHVDRMAQLRDEDDPVDKEHKQLSTTFEVPLGKKAAEEVPAAFVPMPSALSTENVANVAIPVSALLLAGAGAWHAADTFADKRRNRQLDEAIAGKSNTVRDLIRLRARIAKGNADDAEVKRVLKSVKDDDNYIKTAGVVRTGISGVGLLTLALLAASAAGSYSYFSASDPDNMKYKAMKKGLDAYARSKTSMTPISIIPKGGDEYFAGIDESDKEGDDDKDKARELPEQEATHQPISITL